MSSSPSGIFYEASKVLDEDGALSPLEFATWHENTHIQAVQATGGVSRTVRYESLDFIQRHRSNSVSKGKEVPGNINFNYDFLAVYHMPDLSSRNSDEFKEVTGEIEPEGEDSKLLERLLMQTEFSMRFCEAGDNSQASTTKAAPPFLVTVALHSSQKTSPKLDGATVVGRYTVREVSMLSAYERTYPKGGPDEIIIMTCNSIPDLSEIMKQSTEGLEVGVWGLRKEYDGSEREPAQWRPNMRI